MKPIGYVMTRYDFVPSKDVKALIEDLPYWIEQIDCQNEYTDETGRTSAVGRFRYTFCKLRVLRESTGKESLVICPGVTVDCEARIFLNPDTDRWEPERPALDDAAKRARTHQQNEKKKRDSSKGGRQRKKHPAFLQYLRDFLEEKPDGTLDQAFDSLSADGREPCFVNAQGIEYDIYRDERQLVAVRQTRGGNHKPTPITKRSLEPYFTMIRNKKE